MEVEVGRSRLEHSLFRNELTSLASVPAETVVSHTCSLSSQKKNPWLCPAGLLLEPMRQCTHENSSHSR